MVRSYTLVLDIGGTNPRIAMVSDVYGVILPEKIRSDIDLVTQINTYLELCGKKGMTTDTCCISAAGIVSKTGTVSFSHSPIIVDKQKILDNSLLENVFIINDFEAIAHSTKIDSLKTVSVIENETQNGNICIIGPGTGLGVAFIINGEIITSEGGHSSLPSLYPEFISWLEKKLNVEYICAEMVLSGKGLQLLYEWKTGNILQPLAIAQSKDPLAKSCMNMFMEYLGAFSRSIALIGLCSHIYLAGGILPKNKDVLLNGSFTKSLQHPFDTSRTEFIKSIFVELIDDYDCSFLGSKVAADKFKTK